VRAEKEEETVAVGEKGERRVCLLFLFLLFEGYCVSKRFGTRCRNNFLLFNGEKGTSATVEMCCDSRA